MENILEKFISCELNDVVCKMICERLSGALERSEIEEFELELNIFDVSFDLKSRTVTLSDVLSANNQQVLPLREFIELLARKDSSGAWRNFDNLKLVYNE